MDPPAMSVVPTLSVVVPSYRRPDDLVRCLDALGCQDSAPDEIVVVHRADDERTQAVAERFGASVRRLAVDEPGQVAALRVGATATSGEVVAFTDDDAAPRRDWSRRLREAFAAPEIGAVGGRDVVHHGDECVEACQLRVGLVTSFGRIVGNHHIGLGGARDVHHLKGVNMAVRRTCLAFAVGLRGAGAQVGNDLATSLAVASSGHRVVYDPSLMVDHYPAERFDEDGRAVRTVQARADAAFNESFVVFSLRPDLRRRRLCFVVLWGDRNSGGVVRSLAAWLRREPDVRGAFVPMLRAQLEAWRLARAERLTLVAIDAP